MVLGRLKELLRIPPLVGAAAERGKGAMHDMHVHDPMHSIDRSVGMTRTD